MIVQHNQMASNTAGQFKINEGAKMKCLEKLSSGYRINRAAEQTISDIQNAEMLISEQRGLIGAYANRLEHAMAVDAGTSENLQASESRMRDTDIASEAVNNAKNNILEQSIQSMLTNANNNTQGVLSLLS